MEMERRKEVIEFLERIADEKRMEDAASGAVSEESELYSDAVKILKGRPKPKNVVEFTLSMPCCNTASGRWSGEGEYYALFRNIKSVPENARNGSFRYNFGDGWVAEVSTRLVTSAEASKLKKKSKGFCSYEWMAESIISRGFISVD